MATLPDVPIMLLTATASTKVKDILIKNLELTNPKVIQISPDRSNIMYKKVKRQESTKTKDDLDVILSQLCEELLDKRINFPITIVYTDLDCIEYCYEYMNDKMGGHQYEGQAIPENRLFGQFHRYYPEKMKTILLKNLCSPNSVVRLLFATIALGMGLDAPSIRRVIHFKPPTSVERYLQETGRAGRDGALSNAILYYNNMDVRSNRPGIKISIIDYCKSEKQCLRNILLSHLGFEVSPNRELSSCCSVCVHTALPNQ